MTYDIANMIFIGGAVAAGVMLVVTVLLFVLLRIPAVIGDLTGRTARKAIEEIRSQNEQSGVKTYQSSAVNRQRGRITDKISPSGRIQRRNSGKLGGAMSTEELAAETSVLSPAEAGGEETVLLDAQPYTGEETTLLAPEAAPAAPAPAPAPPPPAAPAPQQTYAPAFAVEYDITFIHTNELIG